MSATEEIVWRSQQAQHQEAMTIYYVVEVWVSGMVPGQDWLIWRDSENGFSTIHQSVAVARAQKALGQAYVFPWNTGTVLHSRVRKVTP